MIRFVYPNVINHDNFIGCGRYLTTSADDPVLAEGYDLAVPQIVRLSHIRSAAYKLAPESEETGLEVYEYKDKPLSYLGDSKGLAYLFALIRRSRKTRWEDTGQTFDIWCTGVIEMKDDNPYIGEVRQNEFPIKLEEFLTNPTDNLFIVPLVNLILPLKKECETHHVRVATLSQFKSLPVQEHFTQKTVLQLHGHEIQAFVDDIFVPPAAEIGISTRGVISPREAFARFDIAWNDAPGPLQIWTGREELLREISADWADSNYRMLGLIGFGGEGKSSLVRKWLDELRTDKRPDLSKPDAAFWWNFYSSPNVDTFFEAIFSFMTEGEVDPNEYPSTTAKANFLAGFLYSKRYLLVLDGMEVIQDKTEDRYGRLKNADLRQFLLSLAKPSSQSFCVITSRLPVSDFQDTRTYMHCDVTRLSARDGCLLLHKIGVKGDDQALEQVVTDWDGHALTLCLLASYLVDRYRGNAKHIAKIPSPLAGEPRYKRVDSMLRLYDEHLLTVAERVFLMIFSAFRIPVSEAAFAAVFRPETIKEDERTGLHAPIAALNHSEFETLLERLKTFQILRQDRYYTVHPLIRNYYLNLLNTQDAAQVQKVHQRIKEYYLARAGEMPENPTLEQLTPLIEADHHTCCAGAYDEAYIILRERINQGTRFLLPDILGAWDTYLTVMLEFFEAGNTSHAPRASSSEDRATLLHEVGFCMASLGRLPQAASCYTQAIPLYIDMEKWRQASRSYSNLAELYIYLGKLDAGREAAQEELRLARLANSQEQEIIALCDQAVLASLRGEIEEANRTFQQAEQLHRKLAPHKPDLQEIKIQEYYLYDLEGLKHAIHLRRTGNLEYARHITEANLTICTHSGLQELICQNHRLLGDLDADTGNHEAARRHYAEALKIARSITCQHVLIEILLSSGYWTAYYQHDFRTAFEQLKEALVYAEQKYRLYEADIRVALAWSYLTDALESSIVKKSEALEQAQLEAARARRMSEQMGYYWGKVDAEEVEAEIENCRD